MQEPISKLQEEEHQRYLLTRKSFNDWFAELSEDEWQGLAFHYRGMTSEKIYLAEHGLDLDSVFTD